MTKWAKELREKDAKIEQLRQQNAELVEALRRVIAVAEAAIAKATRGE